MKQQSKTALIGIIADEDTVTGLLLTGVGHTDIKRRTNYLVVDKKTTQKQIEEAFIRFTNPSKTDVPIGVLLISQFIADDIRHLLDDYDKIIPAILEIPSKEHPYEESKDYIMQRVKKLTGLQN
eukprot:TRINITY_DN14732_c0_g1_i1.p1 TRINITY_DN14732_c0_g1~~TRINITY_DN14732_c0_g1_i1.p1  ORF type:complete len:124 (-),score=39.11 TRINITY_DN14732_c0_g1_i1:50-421(-)